jgi:hypothetical protein
LADKITEFGESIKRGERVSPLESNGIRVEFRATHWKDVEDRYGYSRFTDDFKNAARTRRLATDEIQTKLVNSKLIAGTRSGSPDQEEAK